MTLDTHAHDYVHINLLELCARVCIHVCTCVLVYGLREKALSLQLLKNDVFTLTQEKDQYIPLKSCKSFYTHS